MPTYQKILLIAFFYNPLVVISRIYEFEVDLVISPPFFSTYNALLCKMFIYDVCSACFFFNFFYFLYKFSFLFSHYFLPLSADFLHVQIIAIPSYKRFPVSVLLTNNRPSYQSYFCHALLLNLFFSF